MESAAESNNSNILWWLSVALTDSLQSTNPLMVGLEALVKIDQDCWALAQLIDLGIA